MRLEMKSFCLIFMAAAVLAVEDTPALKELKSGNLEFCAKTYKVLAKTNNENFLMSPLSVLVVLALVEAGTGGDTATQLISGLNLPNTEAKIHEAFKAIAPSLNVDGEYQLLSANKVYIKDGLKLKPEFKSIATDIFKASVEEINFTEGDAAAVINKWVSEQTREKINEVFSRDDLDQDTRAVLINALYFHGHWVQPFELDSTKEKTFHVNSKTKVKAKMMEQVERFDYFKDTYLKAKFLKMYYEGSPVSMTVVLPDDIDGLPELEKNIEKVLQDPKYSSHKVHVQIPHVNIEHSIDFIPILKEFGITKLFESSANLSRMLTSEQDIRVSKIVQKTFIAVEEKGTTAAAVTAVEAIAESIDIHQEIPKEFEANHPFIFIIKSTDGVLFVGRYSKPT